MRKRTLSEVQGDISDLASEDRPHPHDACHGDLNSGCRTAPQFSSTFTTGTRCISLGPTGAERDAACSCGKCAGELWGGSASRIQVAVAGVMRMWPIFGSQIGNVALNLR